MQYYFSVVVFVIQFCFWFIKLIINIQDFHLQSINKSSLLKFEQQIIMIVFEQFLGPCLFFAVFIRYTVWLFVFEITLARSIPWIISAIGKNYVSMRRKKKKTEK